MRHRLPPAAARTGELRLELRRIPIASCFVLLRLVDRMGRAGRELARAAVYGRGEGSEARESSMVLLRIRDEIRESITLRAGDEIELQIVDLAGAPLPDETLDVLEIR